MNTDSLSYSRLMQSELTITCEKAVSLKVLLFADATMNNYGYRIVSYRSFTRLLLIDFQRYRVFSTILTEDEFAKALAMRGSRECSDERARDIDAFISFRRSVAAARAEMARYVP